MRVTKNYKVRKIHDVYLIILTGEAVWKKGAVFPVSETGLLIWEKLAEGTDLPSLIRAVTEIYEVTSEQARQDIIRFVTYLQKRGLLIKE